jgi:hypothetical protein
MNVEEPLQPGTLLGDNRFKANRFRCYKEGKRYSWAECSEQNTLINQNIKGRIVGDSLFKLFPDADLVDTYSNFYNGEVIDFTGYQYLEFSARFIREKLQKPFNINLRILGPNNNIYYDNNVLGYATNPLFPKGEDEWVHIKVPIKEFVNV